MWCRALRQTAWSYELQNAGNPRPMNRAAVLLPHLLAGLRVVASRCGGHRRCDGRVNALRQPRWPATEPCRPRAEVRLRAAAPPFAQRLPINSTVATRGALVSGTGAFQAPVFGTPPRIQLKRLRHWHWHTHCRDGQKGPFVVQYPFCGGLGNA